MPVQDEPLFYQGDVHGRIRFDGNATVKTCLLLGSYGLREFSVKGKSTCGNYMANSLCYSHLPCGAVFQKLWKSCPGRVLRGYTVTSKVEKGRQLFALEIEYDHCALSICITKPPAQHFNAAEG